MQQMQFELDRANKMASQVEELRQKGIIDIDGDGNLLPS